MESEGEPRARQVGHHRPMKNQPESKNRAVEKKGGRKHVLQSRRGTKKGIHETSHLRFLGRTGDYENE